MEDFRNRNPNADPVIVDYMEEGVRTFNHGCPKAAAVMIGAASEKAILLLHDKLKSEITDAAKLADFERDCRRSWAITNQYRVLKDRLDRMVAARRLTRELNEIVSGDLPACFEMIRRQRNAAGHPTIVGRHEPDAVFLNLRVMSEFIKGIYSLIEYFDTNPADW